MSERKAPAKPVSRLAIKGNARKANRRKQPDSPGILAVCLPWFVRVFGVVTLAFFLLFVHDAMTQTHLLEIRDIKIQGLESLEREEVLLRAAIPEKANLYDINLHHVRLQLEAHPFIREAKIMRLPPSTLKIQIQEEEPFAVLEPDLVPRPAFLVDTEGRVFKEVENKPEAYGDYMVIRGLPLPGEKENMFWFNQAKSFMELWNLEMKFAAMDIWNLEMHPDEGKESFCLRVDPDLGLFVNHTRIARQISFGLSDYREKMIMLKKLMVFQHLQKNQETYDRIDFIGNNRIVLVPVQTEETPAT